MKNLLFLKLLIVMAIVGIAAFQAYWLQQNYEREKKSFSVKTDIAFRETIRQLQASKLKLDKILPDSLLGDSVKIFVSRSGNKSVTIQQGPKTEIVSTINVLGDKLKDSLTKSKIRKNEMFISMDKTNFSFIQDSSKPFNTDESSFPEHNNFIRFLYDVDSLQNSLKLQEIQVAYAEALNNQNIRIPFVISRNDTARIREEPQLNEMTIGFLHPITYTLKMGNTFPYLFKRITAPVLFSLFLVGFTILSFVLLYKNLLRQRRLAALKNEFISNITHELKTPIATVSVAIEALKNFSAINNPERTKEYLDISSNELQRLNLLVDKVLKLSLFENKGIDLKFESVNMRMLAEEVVASMKLQVEKFHAKVDISSEGDPELRGDRLHLLSIIFNLLDNALKYSNGDPIIKIELKEKDNFVVLSIADNGIGIPSEYKDKVFEKFFRIPAGDTHNAKGYGLGLSYVAHVVQKHNGTVSVESEPGSGTTFTIALPKQNI